MTKVRRQPLLTQLRKSARRAAPEHQLHKAVAEYLALVLTPKNVPWTTVGHGYRGGNNIYRIVMGKKLKAAGLQPGWPDIQIIAPNGRYIGIELKAESSLSPAQKKVHKEIRATGGMVKVCRSLEDVWEVLSLFPVSWGPFPKPT